MTIRSRPIDFLYAEGGANSPRRFEPLLEAFLTGRANPSGEIDRILAQDPNSPFGHTLRAAIVVRADNTAGRSKLLESIAAIEASGLDVDHYARRHATAARAWFDGDQVLAGERYGAIVVDLPHDIVALAVAHALDFRLGLRRMLRDRIAQVLPVWHAAMPGYASVLAMFAFGLEENYQYHRAEKIARRALRIDPRHAAAMHVVVHVLEMQGRSREGLSFLAATKWAWMGSSFSVHLAWHRALFHLDNDDARSALEVYDVEIAHACTMTELADASALLWRLLLKDIMIEDRWQPLADRWGRQALAGARSFYFAHAMMAFAAAGRGADAQRLFELMQPAEKIPAPVLPDEAAVIMPICKALLSFAHGDYTSCLGWLERVRDVAHRCGGSLAQCDLIPLTFIEAALRANSSSIARALVAERMAHKPASLLNRSLQRRVARKWEGASGSTPSSMDQLIPEEGLAG